MMPMTSSSVTPSSIVSLSSSTTTPGKCSLPADATNTPYKDYVVLVEADQEFTDDDAELMEAIAVSLQDNNGTPNTIEETSTRDLISALQQENLSAATDEPVNITIQRRNILSSTLRAISRKRFSFLQRVTINFSGEDAVDGGGPKREYFRLLITAIKEMGIFDGQWFSHDLTLLQDNKYFIAGKLVGWSILQGGPGPRCLAEEGYRVLCDKPCPLSSAIEVVSDSRLKVLLDEIQNCFTVQDFDAMVQKHGDDISSYGFSRIYLSKFSDKDDVLKCLLRQYFVFGVQAEINQFFDGLNHLAGLGAMLKKHFCLFQSLLSTKVLPVDLSVFKTLYKLCWSPEGSNARAAEDTTIYSWELFLQDAEEKQVDVSIQDVLVFITGADEVPPLGLPKLIDIYFYDYDEHCKRRPWVSTCALTLHLPRGFDKPEEFSEMMTECILNSPGFGKL